MFPRSVGKLLAINGLLILTISTAMYSENWLLDKGYLNKKDLWLIGKETGSAYEYLTNIWYWDAAIGCSMMIVALYLIVIDIICIIYKISLGNNDEWRGGKQM